MRGRADNSGTTLVSFSGVDGAGKSTQIRALCEHMEACGLRVRVIPFWDEVAQLTRLREGTGHKVFKGDKGIGTPEAPINRKDKNVQSWPMTAFRLFLYFLDALSVRRKVREVRAAGPGFVVFDRYIYDELANLPLDNPFIRIYAKLLMKLVPRPHVSYILDADPEKARARKPEYPLDFIRKNRRAYLRLNGVIGGMTVVPAMEIDEVAQFILQHALRKVASVTGDAGGEFRQAESRAVAS